MEQDDQGWIICDKRSKKRGKQEQRKQEKQECSHLIRPEKALQLERKLRIDNLMYTLLSEQARQLQYEGWIYTRLLRPDDTFTHEPSWEYTFIDNFNKWDDRILFRRKDLAVLSNLASSANEVTQVEE